MTQSRSEALSYACAGQPVLPLHTPVRGACDCGSTGCRTPGKHPRAGLGVRFATTNTSTIEAWFGLWPAANVGMRCDRLFVFDLDGPAGEESLVRLERELGRLPRTRQQRTSRGRHLLYQLPPRVGARNSTGVFGAPPGIDVRSGAGGYIVAAPSVHVSGAHYRMDDYPLTPLPVGWLRRIVRRTAGHVAYQPPNGETLLLADDTAYGRAALRGELDKLRRLREPGGRHDQLNRATFRLAQLVAAGELAEATVRQAMVDAGLAFGFDEREVRRIVGYAVEAGLSYPRARR